MNDDGGKSGIRDVEEDCSEEVDGEEHNDTGNDTCEGGADTRLRLDSGSREGSGCRICPKEGTNNIGDPNSNKLLGRVDGIVVDSSE